jgi:hypothetical protein
MELISIYGTMFVLNGKYQGNKQIMEISMDIYGNINRMNGNIQRHHGDIMRISYGDFWEYCRRF